MSDEWKPFYLGYRPAVSRSLEALPAAHPVADPVEADLVVVDLSTPYQEDLRQQLDILDRVPDTPRVVLSVLGVGQPGAPGYATEIAELERAVLPPSARWCVLRCAMLGQTLLRYLEVVAATGSLHGCFSEEGVAWLHADDLAALVEVLYRTPERCSGAYDVTGPELIAMPDLATALSKAMDKEVGYEQLEAEHYRRILTESGLPEQVARRLTESHVMASTGEALEPTGVLRGALGRASELESYLDDIVTTAGV